MKPISLFLLVAACGLMTAAVIGLSQTPQGTPASGPAAETYPAPTNLKVLPKDMTGVQVRDVMHEWVDELGGECSTCHVRNPNDIGPNGKPRFNYADDSKEEKKTARVMYTMIASINADYVGKVPNSGMPVTCGTCHRGHLSPPPFSDSEDDASPKPTANTPSTSN